MRTGLVQVLGFLLLAAAGICSADEVRVSRLYELSDFNGTIPYSDVILHVDREHDEVYGVVGNTVRVFNGAGMEIYRFEYDPALGAIFGLAVDEAGEILVLTYKIKPGARGVWSLGRCDYRGEPIGRIEVGGLPEEFASFTPNRMVYHDGRIYLVSKPELLAVVLDRSGQFLQGYDFAALLEIEEPADHEIFGFDVGPQGEMLFTIPVLFKAFVVSPDETVRRFGSPGSAPGKFGIVSGIVADDHAHYLVADKLRRVVMVFDSESFELVTEIGADRRRHPLVRPTELALGNAGRIYISQARQSGVAVFSLTPAVAELESNGRRLAKAVTKGGQVSSTEGTLEQDHGGTANRTSRSAAPHENP